MKLSKGHVPTGCLKLQETARNNSEDLKEKKKYGLPAILSNNDVPEERKTNKPAQIRPDSSSIFHLYNPNRAYCEDREKSFTTNLGRVYQASKNYSRTPLRIDLSEKTILGSKLCLKVSYQ